MRFRKSINIFKGVRMNVSKSGVSFTMGRKGVSANVGKDGVFLNTSLPGTGLYDRRKLVDFNGAGTKQKPSPASRTDPAVAEELARAEALTDAFVNIGAQACDLPRDWSEQELALPPSDEAVEASFSVRSSVESQKHALVDRLFCLTEQLGGTVSTHGDYPGWAYRQDSPLRELMSEVFADQYGHPPVIEAIHAGLECGLFSGKLPGLDCVSIGPDLTDIHTFREKLHVASVARTWALLTEVLRRMK